MYRKAGAVQAGHDDSIRIALCRVAILLLASLGSSVPAQQSKYSYDPPGNLTTAAQSATSAPLFDLQPASQIISQNGTVYFSFLAAGPGPLTYQWLSNGVPVLGATGDVLAVTNVVVPVNLDSNGSFETPVVGGTYATYTAGQNVNGWRVESNTVYLVETLWWAADGAQSMDVGFNPGGAIYEDVPTIPGQQYFLHFALSGDPRGAPVTKTNQVWWNGTLLDTLTFNTTGHSTAAMGWTNVEYLVTATATSTRIRFVGVTAGSYGPVIDNVTLEAVPAPPASYSVIVSNAYGSVTSSVAQVQFDVEGNGLGDSWERTYFGSIGQDPNADSDGDGVSNLSEYLEGTDPTNAASFRPRLHLLATPGGSVAAAPGGRALTPGQPSYALNDPVQISAAPDPGYLFSFWTGGITSSESVAPLVMDGTKTIMAIFGQEMTNGGNYSGAIAAGATTYYAFTANAGENVLLRVGLLSSAAYFSPWLRVYGADGTLIGSGAAAGDTAEDVTFTATNSGTFTVVVSDGSYNGYDGTGTYALHYLKLPGSFVVPAGDEGGAMTNGGNYAGTITIGDVEAWTFTANAGENVLLRVGQSSSAAYFSPWLRVYGPDGALVGSGAVAGATEEDVALTATNSGTFTVVVSDGNNQGYDGTGTYGLHYVKIPGAFVVPPGDEGGPMISGGNYDGTIGLGDLDPWTFTASAEDRVVLRCGKTGGNGNYYPWLLLYGPDGALLSNNGGNAAGTDAYIGFQPTNSGTFTVLVSSYNAGYTGSYRLHLMHIPAPYIVPPGDEGGALVNGGNHDGTNDLGDEDIWTVTANAGDWVILRCGKTSGGANYYPWLRLYGPDGAILSNNGGYSANADTYIGYQTTNSATFTVLVGSYNLGYAGSYRLRLAHIPAPYIVPAGDEGGPVAGGTIYTGVTDLGDMDIWSFTAFQGVPISLHCLKLTGTSSYDPGLQLYGPDGSFLTSAWNATSVSLNYTPTNSGTFTLLVGSYYLNNTGAYQLSGTGFSAGLKLLAPVISGGSLALVGSGGYSNGLFILSTSTNVAQPAALWTPVLTNYFDASGAFNVTNLYDPGNPRQFFRFSVP